jgi:hypothetical protein
VSKSGLLSRTSAAICVESASWAGAREHADDEICDRSEVEGARVLDEEGERAVEVAELEQRHSERELAVLDEPKEGGEVTLALEALSDVLEVEEAAELRARLRLEG